MTDDKTATEAAIAAFLAESGWAQASRLPLAGDASTRRYERLRQGGQTAVLMIAPADAAFARFQQIDAWLLGHGFSAPRILASRAESGLMLLEDFGDALLARLLAQDPSQEPGYYAAITDFLASLHRLPAPEFLASLGAEALADLLALTLEWYPKRSEPAAAQLPALFIEAYGRLEPLPPVLCLRDFHAENVIWLPQRQGPAQLGLLDFQDAVAAHPAYDLVSALQDARRDVSPPVEVAQLQRYCALRGLQEAPFSQAYALLGAQRALRILGVFARLAQAYAKPQYLPLMPRVWRNLQRNLARPGFEALLQAVTEAFPPPDPSLLAQLAQPCPTPPQP